MSTTGRKKVSEYTGEDQYNDWVRDYLGVTLTDAQKEIGRSLYNNERTLVIGANGFGKSWDVACLIPAFIFSNYPASALATSGTYGKLRRTVCKPIQKLHDDATGLPGEYKKTPPRIEIEGEPDVYFQAASPRDAGELEGVHNKYTLGVVEEVDKDDVTAEVIDSMESLLTDHRDRLLVIGNPPRDEANIAAELMDDPTWNVLNYSSFDSHNVQAELGEIDADPIDGLVTLDRIKTDWESWNGTEWPGVEAAKASAGEDALDQRWYRRRLGVMPPDTADAHRPFSLSDVEEAYQRGASRTNYPKGIALDVARMSGDFNALSAVYGMELDVVDRWKGVNHVGNEEKVKTLVSKDWECDFAVDAVGEGSGLADRVGTFYADMIRFQAGAYPARMSEYKDKWAEGMFLLGRFLKNGGSFSDRRLYEELQCAARSVEYESRYLKSRDDDILQLSSKDEIKERLGHSPDVLDSAMMAVWAADEQTGKQAETIQSTW